MAAVKWIKLDIGLPDNRKIKRIRKLPDGDKIILFWVFLLARAGESNQSGGLFFTANVPYTEEDFAADFDFEIDLVRLAILTLERFKMIERFDDIIFVKNWDEYQELDKLAKINEQNRIRQAKYRKKQKLLAKSNVTVALPVTESNAREQELELDKELEQDIIIGDDDEKSPDGNSLDWFFESYEERLGRDLSDDEKDELRVFATTQKMPKSQDLVNLILKTRGD